MKDRKDEDLLNTDWKKAAKMERMNHHQDVDRAISMFDKLQKDISDLKTRVESMPDSVKKTNLLKHQENLLQSINAQRNTFSSLDAYSKAVKAHIAETGRSPKMASDLKDAERNAKLEWDTKGDQIKHMLNDTKEFVEKIKGIVDKEVPKQNAAPAKPGAR